MILTILSSFLGLAASAVPAFIDYFKMKQSQKHELALLGLQIQAQVQLGQLNLQMIQTQGDVSEMMARFQFAAPTGSATWADRLNISVRPIVTFGFFGLYAFIKIILTMVMLIAYPFSVMKSAPNLPWYDLLSLVAEKLTTTVWGEGDHLIFSTILSFWFGDRMFNKGRNVTAQPALALPKTS